MRDLLPAGHRRGVRPPPSPAHPGWGALRSRRNRHASEPGPIAAQGSSAPAGSSNTVCIASRAGHAAQRAGSRRRHAGGDAACDRQGGAARAAAMGLTVAARCPPTQHRREVHLGHAAAGLKSKRNGRRPLTADGGAVDGWPRACAGEVSRYLSPNGCRGDSQAKQGAPLPGPQRGVTPSHHISPALPLTAAAAGPRPYKFTSGGLLHRFTTWVAPRLHRRRLSLAAEGAAARCLTIQRGGRLMIRGVDGSGTPTDVARSGAVAGKWPGQSAGGTVVRDRGPESQVTLGLLPGVDLRVAGFPASESSSAAHLVRSGALARRPFGGLPGQCAGRWVGRLEGGPPRCPRT
jgi:hypothetical protein